MKKLLAIISFILVFNTVVHSQCVGEWFISKEIIPSGRFVALDGSLDKGVRIAEATDEYVIGVVLDATNGIIGYPTIQENGMVAVGLLGKMIVEVSPGIEIHRGDPVGAGIDGMAVTAHPFAKPTYLYRYSDKQPVGFAVEDQRQGKVKVFFK